MTSSTVSDSALVPSRVVVAPNGGDGVSAEPSTQPQQASTGSTDAASVHSVEAANAPAAAASASTSPRASRTMSILALSLGIASFFFAQSVVVPLAAIVLGVFGLRDEPTGRNFSIWGIVLACVASFGWIAVVVLGALISLPILFLAAL